MRSHRPTPEPDYPSYLKTFREGSLHTRAQKAMALLESCAICPRVCKVNRLKNERGICKTGLKANVHSFMAHHGEEPPISGDRGSGTIFFACCNMKCLYCQNFEFSQEAEEPRETTAEELAQIMLGLQEQRCHNINLVTPTHVMPQILQALLLAVPKGLTIPLVYNTGGYERAEMIKMLEGIVDIYLPDMRYASEEHAVRYSQAPGYPQYNRQALKEMHRQVGTADIGPDGTIRKGMIIRHLVLPNDISGTREAMKFIKEELSEETYISLMSQYAPYYRAQSLEGINRRISPEEYAQAKQTLEELGLYNGWTQESFGLERFAGVHIKPAFKAASDEKKSRG